MLKSIYSKLVKKNGKFDSIAENMRINILNSSDSLYISGKKYYFSSSGNDLYLENSPEKPWKSLEKLKQLNPKLKKGDAVFFERGSVFRQEDLVQDELYLNNAVLTVSGVSYGAYGNGPKPLFLGSSKNYIDENWKKQSTNIYSIDFTLQDIGLIALDDGKYIGVKKTSIDELSSNYDFYHDISSEKLYIYCDLGELKDNFYSIEIGCNRPVFLLVGNVCDVTIDNIEIKYVGGHAISGYEFNNRITISNCEISMVGGSWQEIGIVRYGNAIQFWNSCSDILIENCYIHQVYDAGLTFQGPNGAEYKNIVFRNNLIKYCNYSIEFFIQGQMNEKGQNKSQGLLENIEFSNNIMQFSGFGLCEQRPDKEDSAFICGWTTDVDNRLNNFSIINNVFDHSYKNIVNWLLETTKGLNINGNSYYKNISSNNETVKFGPFGQISADNQKDLFDAINTFDINPRGIVYS